MTCRIVRDALALQGESDDDADITEQLRAWRAGDDAAMAGVFSELYATLRHVSAGASAHDAGGGAAGRMRRARARLAAGRARRLIARDFSSVRPIT